MYAVVKTGGQQFRVAKGDKLSIQKLDVEAGKSITLDEVLMVNDGKTAKVGTPLVSGATVTAKVVEQYRDKKVIIFKKKRRQNYRRTKGHRQHLTLIEITDIKSA
ncbi:MAG: 50S ribosomal protein L21 [Alphaproteobacteria bacterium]|nr:MAG: 50S ribosomal protein L21 [Alphaproteobacteria bacterium]